MEEFSSDLKKMLTNIHISGTCIKKIKFSVAK